MSEDRTQTREELFDSWANHVHSGADIFTEIKPVRWVIPQMVPADMVTGIYGAPGSGKSHVALTLALELARGAPGTVSEYRTLFMFSTSQENALQMPGTGSTAGRGITAATCPQPSVYGKTITPN